MCDSVLNRSTYPDVGKIQATVKRKKLQIFYQYIWFFFRVNIPKLKPKNDKTAYRKDICTINALGNFFFEKKVFCKEIKTVYKWSALHNFVSVFLSEYTSISLNKKNVQNCIEYLHMTRF